MLHRRPIPSETNPADRLESLRALPALRSLRGAPLHCVMSLRFCALCEAAGRDPMPDLAVHFGDLEAAAAMVSLGEGVTRCWPEKFSVCRPCCPCLTPDEATLASMIGHAQAGDRQQFAAVLDGFVRAGRHDVLYDLAVRAASAMQGARPPC